jgi:hypothetical protein
VDFLSGISEGEEGGGEGGGELGGSWVGVDGWGSEKALGITGLEPMSRGKVCCEIDLKENTSS